METNKQAHLFILVWKFFLDGTKCADYVPVCRGVYVWDCVRMSGTWSMQSFNIELN